MAINVYWACVEKEWMRATEPESVAKTFYSLEIHDEKNANTTLNYCPSFNSYLKNLYSIKSIYDYEFFVNESGINSNLYDQKFFDNHILTRSLEKKFFSFFNRYIFFTDSEALNISAYQHPIFEQNEVSKKCMLIPGTYDIGKWFRPLEFPFILKDEFNSFSVKYEDVLYYLKFHTEEKITFKQFRVNDTLSKIIDETVLVGANKTKKFSNLSDFYSKLKIKPLILKEIKSNLLL